MKSKIVKSAFPILTIIMIIFSSQAFAHPPQDMVLDYNVTTSTLDVTITHNTLDPMSHYVYKVEIKVNGDLYLSKLYTSQPTSSTFSYNYTVLTNTSDQISVTAFCILFGSITKTLVVPNKNAPDAPNITGPTSGKPSEVYNYTFVTNDPNNDNIFYYIDWGDNSTTEWIGSYSSGEEIIKGHSWSSKGSYTITAKAKDTDGNEGSWGKLNIKMPKTKNLFSGTIIKNLQILLSKLTLIKSVLF